MKDKDISSLEHTSWRCQYHIVFAPKYRRMEIYGQIKQDIGVILRKLCQQKGVEIIEDRACPDHIHMLISIPPKVQRITDYGVFEREKYAIFLEDDNLPELTFFPYCKELLNRYENDTRIMWICGTNYLGKYQAQDGASYMFTKHMLPCGWASWSKKFLKYYDGKIEKFRDPYVRERFFKDFPNKAMLDVYAAPLLRYEKEIDQGKNPYSWDYQMCLTVRTNSMFGISPVCNQIRNIGVDMDSEHGGNSMNKVMTRRFCGMPSYPLEFPLKHPKAVMTDLEYESRINKIVTPPFYMRVRHMIAKSIKFLMRKNQDEPLFKKR